jgi:hypothetical protein
LKLADSKLQALEAVQTTLHESHQGGKAFATDKEANKTVAARGAE